MLQLDVVVMVGQGHAQSSQLTSQPVQARGLSLQLRIGLPPPVRQRARVGDNDFRPQGLGTLGKGDDPRISSRPWPGRATRYRCRWNAFAGRVSPIARPMLRPARRLQFASSPLIPQAASSASSSSSGMPGRFVAPAHRADGPLIDRHVRAFAGRHVGGTERSVPEQCRRVSPMPARNSWRSRCCVRIFSPPQKDRARPASDRLDTTVRLLHQTASIAAPAARCKGPGVRCDSSIP